MVKMARYGFSRLKLLAGAALALALAGSALPVFAQAGPPPSAPTPVIVWDVPAFNALPEDGPAEFMDKPGRSLLAPGATKRFAMSVRWLPDVGRLIGPHEVEG